VPNTLTLLHTRFKYRCILYTAVGSLSSCQNTCICMCLSMRVSMYVSMHVLVVAYDILPSTSNTMKFK
jgi:hypothetical protein